MRVAECPAATVTPMGCTWMIGRDWSHPVPGLVSVAVITLPSAAPRACDEVPKSPPNVKTSWKYSAAKTALWLSSISIRSDVIVND